MLHFVKITRREISKSEIESGIKAIMRSKASRLLQDPVMFGYLLNKAELVMMLSKESSSS